MILISLMKFIFCTSQFGSINRKLGCKQIGDHQQLFIMKKIFLLISALFIFSTAEAQFKSDLEGTFFDRPLITGKNGMVTSLHPLSSMAGMQILMQGGNAFDAAVATAIATTVVDPKNSTIGGNGFATMYIAATNEVKALNFFGPSPQAATIEKYRNKEYSRGILASPVPSNLKGYQAILETYGTMSWEQVLAPAIAIAQNGFVFTANDSKIIEERADILKRFPTTKAIFFRDGRPIQEGEILIQKDLANTLKAIAEEGPDVFYKGRIAEEIVDFYQKNGGLLTKEDLANYRARWVTPLKADYRGYTIYTQPPNSSAIALLMQLKLLEGFELKNMEHNSPEYLNLLAQVMQLALADRNKYVGDPDFVEVPTEKMLSKSYAAQRRKLIKPKGTMSAVKAGELPRKAKKSNTTHMTIVDGQGNMVALTQTLGAWYGSGVTVGNTGVMFSNQMRHLHLEEDSPSRIEPGKRPRSNQSPTIVLKDGRPFMAIGTPGGDGIWQRLTQVLVNIIDFKMDIQTAISAPRIIYGGYQETGTTITPSFVVEKRMGDDTARLFAQYGVDIEIKSQDEGRVNGVMIDPKTGFLLGGADPRNITYAIGW